MQLPSDLLDVLVRDNSENSFLTGGGALVVTELDASSNERYPDVFKNLPNTFRSIELQVNNFGATLDINDWLPQDASFLNLDQTDTIFSIDDFLTEGAYINWKDGSFYDAGTNNSREDGINDGADDMYDWGNVISTNLSQSSSSQQS